VDVLNRFIHGNVGSRNSLFERIKVDRYQINRPDAVFPDGRFMGCVASQVKQSAVNFWVERLHPPIEHFRETGVIPQLDHRQTRIAQGPGSSARGNQFDSGGDECLSEWNETGLVKNREKSASYSCHNPRLKSARNFG